MNPPISKKDLLKRLIKRIEKRSSEKKDNSKVEASAAACSFAAVENIEVCEAAIIENDFSSDLKYLRQQVDELKLTESKIVKCWNYMKNNVDLGTELAEDALEIAEAAALQPELEPGIEPQSELEPEFCELDSSDDEAFCLPVSTIVDLKWVCSPTGYFSDDIPILTARPVHKDNVPEKMELFLNSFEDEFIVI